MQPSSILPFDLNQHTPQRMSHHPDQITLSGVPLGYSGKLIAEQFAQHKNTLLFVALDERRAEAAAQSLRFFAPKTPVVRFPAWDCAPFDRMSPNAVISATRMAVLSRLASMKNRRIVVVATLNGLTQYVPTPDYVRACSFSATVGRRVNEAALKSFLLRMGYQACPMVTGPGEFAIRGGLMDIFPPGAKAPLRLDLFGDQLEELRRFDPVTQKTIETLDHFTLAAASEVVLDEEAITLFRSKYRSAFGAKGAGDPLYEAISAGRRHIGLEHWLAFFQKERATLLDFLPDTTAILDDGFDAARQTRWDDLQSQYLARIEAAKSRSALSTGYNLSPVEELYISPDDLEQIFYSLNRLYKINSLSQPTGPGVLDYEIRPSRNFAAERRAGDGGVFTEMAEFVEETRHKKHLVIASFSNGARTRLQTVLSDYGIKDIRAIKNASEISEKGAVYLTTWPLEAGFETKDHVFSSEQDIFGQRLIRTQRSKKRAENYITEAATLAVDDLVVHIDHGIGRYKGLEAVKAAGTQYDCILIEYAGGDRLYLPVENIELLSRYGHDEGLLDRLGGGAWQAKKAKLKDRIKDMAERLLRIAAERALRKGAILEPIDGEWDKFCAGFPYSETEDQLAAIEDVLADLSSGTPMDRLICGDVGFGKTEIALRAAFVAAASGRQVAVIAPTTLLARQHFQSFEDRFRTTDLIVKPLSRFVGPKEARATKEGLQKGGVDVLVGTHAVLSDQVKFKDLGLLIVDEEQRFGVAQKERLKQLSSDVHVLTLTATPIPRTLQLSLSGVRALSVISTPPLDRMAIRTYVSEFDAVTIREAILREHYRGGQSFFVVPRISDLPEIEAFLTDHVPEIRFQIAHGQMPSSTLEARMNAFYEGAFDLLLATSIIESGLDIPQANTMIVWRADKFGLAQLYQIRGRVGRSTLRGYAYLTTKPRAPLSPQAQRRLQVLGTLDRLGAGYALASQDLDIRGSGNILGEEQSGQVREVGFELYQDMLSETIAKLKAGELGQDVEIDGKWSPKINLGVSMMIPEDYVSDLDLRLGLYRRLSHLKKKVEFEGFAAELIDRFGPLPEFVSALLKVVRIKALCRAAGIAKFEGGPKGATLQFHNDKFSRPENLAEYIRAPKNRAQIKDNSLIILRDWKNADTRLQQAEAIAQEFVKFSRPEKP